ncbi:MAG TPA: FUSC family protein [Stellaceae bacterium]|nr:FUSC family protein [Stellaceae bacterium]
MEASRRTDLRGAAPDLARLPIVFNLRALSIAEGLRAGLSTAAIVAGSEWLHRPQLLEAGLGALLTCLCDAGGPMRRRVPALLSFSLLGALVIGGGGLLRAHGLGFALPAALAGILCATLVRIYGQAAQQVGTLLCVVLVLSLDRTLPDLASAATLGGTFLAGGLWATLLTLGLWRLHPYLPARRALAGAYRSLALLTQDLRAVIRAGTADADWERHARAHRRTVREAIETARGAVLETVRSRGPASARAAQSVIRLEAADQLFGALIALSELLETAGSRDRAIAARILRRLRPLLRLLARAMLTDRSDANEKIGRTIGAVAGDIEQLPAGSPLRAPTVAILERLRIAQTLSIPENFVPATSGPSAPLWSRVRDPLLANLNWQSLAFRHSLRATAVMAPALLFTLVWFTPYDHWLTITIVATMQPYFGITFTRALERIAGTLIGGFIAALLSLLVTSQLAIAGAMFPLAVLALAVRAVSFGLFMAALTPMIVLLVELGQPGVSEWMIAGARALFTVAGGLVAVAGCYLLWPSWEPNRLADEIRAAIAAHARYAAAVFALLTESAETAAVEQARRGAGLASNNAEASISRALLEPGTGGRDRLEAAMVIDAALRRLAGRLSAMQLEPGLGHERAPDVWRAWRRWIVGSLEALATGGTAPPPRPPDAPGPGAQSLARIARQIELMAGTIERLRR